MIGTWFGTAFDVPATALSVPVDVTSGQDPGVSIVDQVTRGTGIVGRVTGDFGAVALKVRGDGGPVRVAVVVHLDELATRWWSDRVRPARLDPERPRVVLLRSQGAVRGAVVLARRQGWRGAAGARATVEFDLTAAELGGMLVVELGEPALPSWAAQRLTARGALGLRIDRISVRPRTSPKAGTPAPAATGCPFVIIDESGPTRFRLTADPVAPAPPVPRSPGTRLTRRKPSRAVFKALRMVRRAAGRALLHETPGPDLGVQAADLVTGEPVDLEVTDREVRLVTPPVHPVLIGVRGTHLSCQVTPLS